MSTELHLHETLTIADIMRIFHVGQVTVYRWVKSARQGKGQFPLPIGGHKQKLCWTQESIAAFQNGTKQNESNMPPKIESARQRSKRHTAAMQSLQRRGVGTGR